MTNNAAERNKLQESRCRFERPIVVESIEQVRDWSSTKISDQFGEREQSYFDDHPVIDSLSFHIVLNIN